MSKSELARRSGLSVLTIDRVERGMTCRMDTMRKILLGLGLTLDEKDLVFEEDGLEPLPDGKFNASSPLPTEA